MKIKSKIDEVVCIGVTITGGPTVIVNAEYGYLAEGFPCGQVKVNTVVDENVGLRARQLLEALEEHLCSKLNYEPLVGDGDGSEEELTPKDIKGLIPRDF